MNIYQHEINDGLGEAIASSTTIACESLATISEDSSFDIDNLLNKIKADSNPDQIDLYYIKSVLVSTGWNKNDDVFAPAETWAARNTPEDKQFNFMHDENDIIGHITGSYVVDKEGNKVEAEEAPEQFDIIAEAVLYNSWTDPDNRERMRKIIAEIKEGKWFVSMECLFAGFDYAITMEDGTSKTLARDEETAFLTKHLKSYGGTGEYQGYKVGRSLKQISFSGKGLVARPANPRSVILNASKAFDHQIVLQDLKQGEVDMSNENLLEQQIADLKVELASAKEALEAANAKESAEAITSLESEVAAQAEAIKTLEESVAEKDATITELQETLAKDKEEMKEKMEELRKMQKARKTEKRVATLVELGLDSEEAEESVASYEEFDDAAFEAIVAAMTTMKKKEEVKAKKPMAATEEEEEKPKAEEETEAEEVEAEEAAAEEVTEKLFDGVESTEATLVDASDETDEIEATRASVAAWLENNVLSK
jgi:uncharacterized coiled-coil protein SlyX